MSNFYNDLINKIKTLFVAASIANGNINETALTPNEKDDLPACNIYTLSGSGTLTSGNKNDYESDVEITIELFDTAATDKALGELMNTHLEALKYALFQSSELAGSIKLKRFSWQTQPNVAGHKRMAGLQLKLTGEFLEDFEFTDMPTDLESMEITLKHGDKELKTNIDLTT